MNKLQIIAALILGLSAAAFGGYSFSQTFGEVSLSTSSSGVREAKANYELNSATTDNVYQQIVVAGWGTKDMAEAVALETAAVRDGVQQLIVEQQRTSALLAIMVAFMGAATFILALGTRGGASRKVSDEPAVVNPETIGESSF